ncbi:tRNA (uridine(54)-C5)-methyltransferase TrmA [Teredinibacter haidensis]|mgnify:CR=1 FL=1|uniref:tRNA (uridine(54)-C5)-methyltransferase TrmA n=1 Tax=Teredinibacter haidensis TaxID=2731755 RepID=UPI000948EC5F|nr:tRNA (uridine(54)-C5)-methyltransferase TrmA [Teredinibacter haidensis]
MQHTGTALAADYEQQLNEKITVTESEFTEFSPPELEVFPSPASHFRMRAEFKIWHDKETGSASYAMHKPGVSNKPFIIEDFTIGSATINQLMPALLTEINLSETLKRKLFQAEFLTTTKQEALISLIYHKPITEEWRQQAKALAEKLQCKIIGRSRKQKMVIDNDWVTEKFTVGGKKYQYQQVENSFTQPNAVVCSHMLNWAIDTIKNIGGDLLELYCGNGNFTLPLSRQFNKVLATEISKTSVNSAKFNMQENQCNNIDIARMSSEEFTQALNREREFRRLKHIDLDDYDFSTIFVDPPRSGLDPDTEELAARFDNILYISCNPTTLKKNIDHLSKTHTITRFALFDQFPYTDHRECGVLLQRRK